MHCTIYPMIDNNQKRCIQLQTYAKQNQQAIIVTRPSWLRLLLGQSQMNLGQHLDCLLLITPKTIKLWASPLIQGKFVDLSSNIQIQSQQQALTQAIKQASELKNNQVLAQLDHIPADYYLRWSEQLGDKWQVKSYPDNLEQLFSNLDKDLIKLAESAGKITREVWVELQSSFKVGVSELEIQLKLYQLILKHLGLGFPDHFPAIVAFGANTAVPHHQTSQTKLEKEMPILVDFGVNYSGIFSDFTRTFWFGSKPSSQFENWQQLVKQAYDQAISSLDDGQKPSQIDAAARQVFADNGVEQYFIHSTGHGLATAIHQPPSLSPNSQDKMPKRGLVTIEPGLYLPDQFGVRYENTILVDGQRVKELT